MIKEKKYIISMQEQAMNLLGLTLLFALGRAATLGENLGRAGYTAGKNIGDAGSTAAETVGSASRNIGSAASRIGSSNPSVPPSSSAGGEPSGEEED